MDRRTLLGLLALGLASRVLFVGVAWAAGAALPALGGDWNASQPPVTYLSRWDSGWYADVARFGYGFKPGSWAFPPAFPLATAAVHAAVPGLDFFQAGFVVTHLAFFAALLLLWRLSADLFDAAMAWRTAGVFAFFPSTFYHSAVLAESTLLAFALASLLAAHRGRWAWAGIFAGLAAVARPTGILLLPALAAGLVWTWRSDGRIDLPRLAALPLAALPTALFMIYGWWVTGDLFVTNHAREAEWSSIRWHAVPMVFSRHYVDPDAMVPVFLGFVLAAAVTAWSAREWVRTRDPRLVPVTVFTAALFVVHWSYGWEQNIWRYLAGFVPVYWWVARAAGPLFPAVLLACAAAGAYVASVWARWGPLN